MRKKKKGAGPEKSASGAGDLAGLERINREILSHVRSGVIIYGPDLRYRLFNPFMEKITGVRSSAVLGRHPLEVFPFLKKLGFMEKLESVLVEGAAVSMEFQYAVKATGRSGWAEGEYSPLRDGKGRIVGVIGAVRDITERKCAEMKVLESEMRYRTLFDQARDSIMVLEVRPAGPPLILEANDAALRIHGYKREELVGRPITVLDAEVDALALVEDRMRTIRAKKSAGFEVVHRRKDGSLVVLEASVRAIDVSGRALLVDISRDLTERKRSEQELRASERRYKTIFDSSSDPLMLLTPEGGFFRGNPAALRLFGCADEGEFTSMAPADLSPGRQPDGSVSPDKARKMMAIAMEKGSHFFEWTHKRVRGGEFFATVLLTKIELDGRPVLQATVRDITELRQAEEILRNAQKLESIGALAGGIAHDFNNMLAGIIGNLSLLESRLPPEGEAGELLSDIASTAEKAKQLSNRLLVFAKGGAPAKKRLDVGRVLKDSVGLVAHGSSCRFDISVPALALTALADESQLVQAFSNLALNAAQAMPGGGVVRVAAGTCRIDAASGLPIGPGKFIRITIADDGPGIPAEIMPRIFEPYFTTKTGGHGLGLSIAYSVIARHGGRLLASSENGGGAVFTAYLPLVAGEAASAIPKEPEAGKVRGGRVLVMDDDESVRRSVARMLKALNYECVLVADGAAALEAYRNAASEKRPFTAVIMDLTIPGAMGGREAVLKLRELDPKAKVLVSSGYSEDPVMGDFRSYGFDAALAKPYRFEELGRALSSLAAGGE